MNIKSPLHQRKSFVLKGLWNASKFCPSYHKMIRCRILYLINERKKQILKTTTVIANFICNIQFVIDVHISMPLFMKRQDRFPKPKRHFIRTHSIGRSNKSTGFKFAIPFLIYIYIAYSAAAFQKQHNTTKSCKTGQMNCRYLR